MKVQLISASNLVELEIEQLREIYLDSFPPDERREWKELHKLLDHPHFNLYKITKDDELAGMITIWRWSDFTFIEHFAIHENIRRQGIGKKVLKQIIEEKPSKLIVEVEEPHNELALKRITFYKLIGFSVCEQEYYQPPYKKGSSSVKMHLLSYPQKLTQQEFTNIQSQLYREVYQLNNFTDFP